MLYALISWLICSKQEGIKSCGKCQSCKLIKTGNHPDYYKPEPDKGRHSLGVESIRAVIESLYGSARLGGSKVIWIQDSELLTEQASNALLKTLEDPPEKTYFILGCQEPSRLLPTIISRCLYWQLLSPDEALVIRWLQQEGEYSYSVASTALRLCSGAPLSTQALLESGYWQYRLSLCAAMKDVLQVGDFLTLLPLLNRDKYDAQLHWLLSLLTDAVKLQQGAQDDIVNADKIELVNSLSGRWTAVYIHNKWQQWINCLRKLRYIRGVNSEWLLTYQLLNWEQEAADQHGNSI